jgi:hypothetical protein
VVDLFFLVFLIFSHLTGPGKYDLFPNNWYQSHVLGQSQGLVWVGVMAIEEGRIVIEKFNGTDFGY